MIIDAHTHINHVQGKSSSDLKLNLDGLLKQMNKAGVDLSLIIASNKIDGGKKARYSGRLFGA